MKPITKTSWKATLDAAECERDIRLPRGLVGGGIGREVAGAPRHHICIQRLGNKKTATVTARSRASLVANVVNAVDIEAVGVEMLTDILTGEGGGNDLVASLIGARFGIVFEILAEDGVRQRFFHRSVSAVLSVGYVYGDELRLAAYGAEAHAVFHILVSNLISVENVSIAVGLVHLDRAVEGKVHNGATESLLAIEIGIHKNHFHLLILPNNSSPFCIVAAANDISSAFFKHPHNCVFHLFGAIIGRKETGDPFVAEFDRLFLICFRLCHNILNSIRRQLALAEPFL